MNLIDTHCHYNSYIFNNLDVELDKLNDNKNISKIINVGLDYNTSKEVLELSNRYSNMYASLGIHPLFKGDIFELISLYNKYDNSKIVAIGEVGIDYSNYNINMINNLIDSIKLANRLKLPLIIHANTPKGILANANRLIIEIFKKYTSQYGFVFHSFQPDLDIIIDIIRLGGYIGIGPMILKKNAKKSLEVVRNIDINNLLIETDYPYLSNNEVDDLTCVFKKVCLLKCMDEYSIKNYLEDNAKRLFYKLK